MRILTIDIGGSSVKLRVSGRSPPRRFSSGTRLTPARFVERAREVTQGWRYEGITIGFPGRVGPGGVEDEPPNLSDGWVGYDFARAFERPVKIINDAAMQALGSYRGGRMLYLGFGTSLGSTLISGQVIVPLELGALQYHDGQLDAALGNARLQQVGREVWQRAVEDAVAFLRAAFVPGDTVLLTAAQPMRRLLWT